VAGGGIRWQDREDTLLAGEAVLDAGEARATRGAHRCVGHEVAGQRGHTTGRRGGTRPGGGACHARRAPLCGASGGRRGYQVAGQRGRTTGRRGGTRPGSGACRAWRFSISLCASMCLYVPVCASVCLYVPLCASMWLYVPLCASMCLYVPLCASMCLYVPLCALMCLHVAHLDGAYWRKRSQTRLFYRYLCM
jgi:hypothetical protein